MNGADEVLAGRRSEALRERDKAEAEQEGLIGELRTSIDNVAVRCETHAFRLEPSASVEP